MKGRLLTTLLMLLAITAVCFISAPVHSGEHPWDSDNSNGSGGKIIIIPDSLDSSEVSDLSEEPDEDDLWDIMTTSSSYLLWHFTGVLLY